MSTDQELPATKQGMTGQIPGLGNDGPGEAKPHGRRVGVRESDSDYVKLAKRGGQKDLLRHGDTVLSKAGAYKPSDWFCPDESVMNNGERKGPGGPPRLLDAPFGTSVQERSDDSSNGKKKKQDNVPSGQMERMSLSGGPVEGSKFKKVSQKPGPVDMSKLLSFGYMEESKPTTAAIDLPN